MVHTSTTRSGLVSLRVSLFKCSKVSTPDAPATSSLDLTERLVNLVTMLARVTGLILAMI